MKIWLLLLLAGCLLPGAACGSPAECSCAGPGNVYYDLAEGVPSGGSVEICFEQACAVDVDPFQRDGRTSGSVREEALGTWVTSPAKALTVTVRRADGSRVHRASVVATKEQGGCCGPYRQLRT
jgi:hypothetical protein